MDQHQLLTRVRQRLPGRHGYSFTAGALSCDAAGKVVYSYGRHFPLAVYLGPRDGQPVFLKNGEPATPTTSSHQSLAQRLLPGPTAGLRALQAAGLDLVDLTLDHLVDVVDDSWLTLTRRADGTYQRPSGERFHPPCHGRFLPSREPDPDGAQPGHWHTLGGVLLQDDGRCLLGALDERTYFVAELPEPVPTIDAAFERLKPDPVKQAEAAGRTVRRQGEWFFVDTGLTDRDLGAAHGTSAKAMFALSRVTALPYPAGGNRHVGRQVVFDGELLARGVVRHLAAWSEEPTREHRPLRLGPTWHQVHHNTEVASWTAAPGPWSRGRWD